MSFFCCLILLCLGFGLLNAVDVKDVKDETESIIGWRNDGSGSYVVLQAGKNPTLIHNVQFEKKCSNPFFAEGLMYVKSNESLYCIGTH